MRLYIHSWILLLAAPVAAQSAVGPTERGSVMLAGSASLSRSDIEGNKTTSISLQPNVLYFVANRVAIGGQLGVGYSDRENGETTAWTLGPAARLYFGGSGSKTLPYLGVAVLFGSASTETDEPIASESDASLWGIEGVAGLTFMVSRQVGIAAELFVNRDENEFDTGTSATVTTTATSFGLRVGIAAFVF